jgi:5-methylthioadenosine/S-adenosylhomocysteine deaminase
MKQDNITVLDGGVIVTMSAERDILHDCALVIKGRNIEKIGPSAVMCKTYQGQAEFIDCRGKVLFPGFINTHIHSAQSMVRGVAEDMGRAPSYTRSVPQGDDLSAEESYVMSMLGAATAMKFGSTLISDNYAQAMSNAAAFDKLGIRAVVSERVHDVDFYGLPKGIYAVDKKLGDELLDKNIALIEKWRDNSEGRITACLGPHAPDTCSVDLLKRMAALADQYDLPVTIHLAQSKQELQRISAGYHTSPANYLKDCGLLNRRLMAAHCVFIEDDDISLLADNRVNVVHIPVGNAKAGSIARICDMEKKGINVAIGTDNGSGNMIENIRMALIAGRILGQSVKAQNPDTILEMATVNGADAVGMSDQIGSLEAGKKADIVIMDYNRLHLTPCMNIVGNLVHLATGNDVHTLFVDGKPVLKNYRLTTIDEEQLKSEARAIALCRWEAVNHECKKKNIFIF